MRRVIYNAPWNRYNGARYHRRTNTRHVTQLIIHHVIPRPCYSRRCCCLLLLLLLLLQTVALLLLLLFVRRRGVNGALTRTLLRCIVDEAET